MVGAGEPRVQVVVHGEVTAAESVGLAGGNAQQQLGYLVGLPAPAGGQADGIAPAADPNTNTSESRADAAASPAFCSKSSGVVNIHRVGDHELRPVGAQRHPLSG